MRGADGGGEAEEVGFRELAGEGLVLEVGVLGKGLGANVGGEELGVAAFEAEVGGGLVGEEPVGVLDEIGVEGDHAVEIGGGCGRGGRGGREGVSEPVEAPLEGADDAVGVAGGECGLPGEHPVCVEPGEHSLEFSKGGWVGYRRGVCWGDWGAGFVDRIEVR